MFFHELAHVDADQVIFAVKQKTRQRLAQLGLAHPGGAKEQETSLWAAGSDKPERERRMALATAAMASFCPPHAGAICLPSPSSLSRSPCISLDTGMPVARLTTSAISSAPTCVRATAVCAASAPRLAYFGLGFLQALFECGQLAVLQLGHTC
jgi:hypothetical protein